MMLTAKVIQNWMHRGSEFELTTLVTECDSDDPINLTGRDVTMYLMHSFSQNSAALIKAGTAEPFELEQGLVKFVLEPADTAELRLGGYDLVIVSDHQVVHSGKFGLYPGKPGGEEE